MRKCCINIESAFGSRDPLAPEVASLDVESTASPTARATQTDFAPAFSTTTTTIPTLSGTHDSIVTMSQDKIVISPTSAGKEPSVVPAPGFSPCPDYSKVVAFGSKALQPTATRNRLPTISPRNILSSILEHEDILYTLMLNCPNFATLFALVTTCKKAKCAFEQHPHGIIKAMLDTMSQELQHLTVALMEINGTRLGTSRSIKSNMEAWLGLAPKPRKHRLEKNPLDTVRKLACSFSAIDLFMAVIAKNCVKNFTDYRTVLASRVGLDYDNVIELSNKHPLLQQTEWSDVPDDTEWDVPGLSPPEVGPQAISLPLNEAEIYRIKRALLRYELFCAIFYLGPDGYFDNIRRPRHFNTAPESCRRRAFRKDQVIFLKEYVNPWEIGELAVVSQFMFDLVRNAYFHQYKILRYAEAEDSWYGQWGNKNYGQNRHDDHEEVVDKFDDHMVWFTSQGLTLLRRIYDDRKLGYSALIEKHGKPRYRHAELFILFEKCADRQIFGATDPSASWTPRKTWPDTPGMELPSKGWLAKSPASNAVVNKDPDDAYWGEKWMRKIGYFIWDRD